VIRLTTRGSSVRSARRVLRRYDVTIRIAGILVIAQKLSPFSRGLGRARVNIDVVRQGCGSSAENEGRCEGNLGLAQHCRVSLGGWTTVLTEPFGHSAYSRIGLPVNADRTVQSMKFLMADQPDMQGEEWAGGAMARLFRRGRPTRSGL